MDGSDKDVRKLFPDPEEDDLSSHAHRQLIGAVGMVLPVLLWLIAGWRPLIGDHPWLPLSSISAYYYSGAVSIFAGLLIALALFLFTYKGYDNQYYLGDRILACIAGTAAILIALFPTGAPDQSLALPWWRPLTGVVHLTSAAVLFTCFIIYSLFLFPMSNPDKTQPLPWDKQVRNIIYRVCGVAIALCMGWVIYTIFNGGAIFWPEALALEFFAISWLVKGRIYATAAAAGHNSLYYARYPKKLVQRARRGLRARSRRSRRPAPQHNV